MKKNRMMRLASALLVAVLLTTCAISGTFAKYVTTASASDTARVAKFGVTLTVANDDLLFSDTYTSTNGLTVATSSVGTNLVAPGTSSTENGGTTTVTISGTPEVAVAVSALIDSATAKDVFLKAGTYKNWTTEDPADTFTLAADYYPVKWTLKQDGTALVTDGKLSDVIAAFSTYTTANTQVAPNAGVTTTFTLDWAWDFSVNDEADTLLGQIIAGTETTVNTTDYSTDIGYDFDVSVTQID